MGTPENYGIVEIDVCVATRREIQRGRESPREPERVGEPQRASESFIELQRAAIDDTEKLIQSFNFSKICRVSH